MANVRKRISELTALTSASLDTTLVGVDGGTTYKIELDTLADAVTSRVNILDRDRLNALESVTSSFETKGRSVISSSTQITSYGFISESVNITSLNSFTSSQSTLNTAFTNGINSRLQTSSFNDFSSSVHTEILAATNEQDLSYLVTTSSFNTYTASISTGSLVDRLSSLENNTGSYLTSLNGTISSSAQITSFGFISESIDISSLNSFTSSQSILNTAFTNGINARLQTSSFNEFSTSVDSRIIAATNEQSFNGLISGSSQLTSSLDTRYALSGSSVSINSGSFATTGSNSFNGNQTITGSLVVSAVAVVNGGLTIPTASVITLTSGSSISIDSSGAITGSLTGSVFGIGDVVAFSASLNNRIISGSAVAGTVSGSSQLTASYDLRYTLSGSVSSVPVGTISGSSQLTSSYDTRYTLSSSYNTDSSSFNSRFNGLITTGSNTFSGSQVFSGSMTVTSGQIVASSITANTSSLYLTSGSNMYLQNNGIVEITGSLKVKGTSRFETVGGDEGGEIEFGIPQTNTSLTSSVKVDVYQNRFRIFDGNTNGVFIDLSKAPTGANGELMQKASGFVNAGDYVTLGNLKARIPTSGNRSLQVATVSGTYSVYGSGIYSQAGSIAGTTLSSPLSITTTPAYLNASAGFTVAGATDTWIISDTVNFIAWRITIVIGPSFNANLITIERLY